MVTTKLTKQSNYSTETKNIKMYWYYLDTLYMDEINNYNIEIKFVMGKYKILTRTELLQNLYNHNK